MTAENLKPTESQAGKERNDRLQGNLNTMKVDLLKDASRRHEVKRAKAIENALVDAVKVSESSDKSADKSDKMNLSPEKRSEERVKELKEFMKTPEGGKEITERTYGEITDFDFNQEMFNGPDGWKSEYEKSAKKDQSMEEFVMEKQNEQLNVMRLDLSRVRISAVIPDLFEDLKDGKSDSKKLEADRKKKEDTLYDASTIFFDANKVQIEKIVQGEVTDPKAEKDVLMGKYILSVFGKEADLTAKLANKNSPEYKLVAQLYNTLIEDYSAMMAKRDLVKEQNPLMVQMLLKGKQVSEEEWIEQLGKLAKEKADKMAKEKEKKEKDNVDVVKSSPSTLPTLSGSGSVDSVKILGSTSSINITPTGEKGSYAVTYPSLDNATKAVSNMKVSTYMGADGKPKQLYIVDDENSDSPTVARDDKELKRAINARYIDHGLNEGVKRGTDYLGPSLNEVVHDDQMMVMADKFFAPKNLAEYVLTQDDMAAFKTFVKILISPANNIPGKKEKGEYIYGDMRSIYNRLALLNYAMDEKSVFASIKNNCVALKNTSVVNISTESLCEKAGMPHNFGNYPK